MIRTARLLAPLTVALLLLTACAAGPAAAPTPATVESPAAVAEPTPTPTPTPTAPAAAALVVRSQSVTIYDADSVPLADYGYVTSTTSEAVAGLSEVFGAPAAEEFEARGDSGPGVRYRWAGMVLRSETALADVPLDELYPLRERWSLTLEAPTVAGIRVETLDGIAVGQPIADVEARYPESVTRYENPAGEVFSDIFLDATPPYGADADDPDDAQLSWRVHVDSADGDLTVGSIRAPSANFGA